MILYNLYNHDAINPEYRGESLIFLISSQNSMHTGTMFLYPLGEEAFLFL